MLTNLTSDIAGALLVEGMKPMGAPAYVGAFGRWHTSANSITRRYRGERPC